MKPSILFIVRGDTNVPSCRFRAWQYAPHLKSLRIQTDFLLVEQSKNPVKQLLFHIKLLFKPRKYSAVIQNLEHSTTPLYE